MKRHCNRKKRRLVEVDFSVRSVGVVSVALSLVLLAVPQVPRVYGAPPPYALAEVDVLSYGDALEAPDFTWTSSGETHWFPQRNVTHDGQDAVESGELRWADGASDLSTIVTGPGIIRFWWKIHAPEAGYGLKFFIGNRLEVDRRGDVDWEERTFYLAPGQQTLTWSFYVDDNGPYEGQVAWLDQFTFTPGESPPIIWQQPKDHSVAAWRTVRLATEAVGTPALSYQWQREGTDIPGATNPVLELKYVQETNSGNYRCIVSNANGSATSSNATVTVSPSDVAAWGSNEYYDDRRSGQIEVPVGLTNVVAISAGGFHSLALGENGAVVAWGDNQYGQTNLPEEALSNVAAIAAGGFHSLALRHDGSVIAWGANWDGQIVVPPNLSNVVAVACGVRHSLALDGNGTVAAWGMDWEGQTVVPPNLSNVVALAAGIDHSLALRSDGTVVAWGGGTQGQATVPGDLSNVVAIAAGDLYSLALRSDGTIVKWGGRSDITPGLSNVIAISASDAHALALQADGRIAALDVPPALPEAAAVSAGFQHSLALLASSPSAAPTALGRVESVFHLSVPTKRGKAYFLESCDTLDRGTWTLHYGLAGDGTTRTFLDPAATIPQRFYRIRTSP